MLRALARKIGFVTRLHAAWNVQDSLEPLAKEVRRLRRDLDAIQETVRESAERAAEREQITAQATEANRLNKAQQSLVARLPTLLDEAHLASHVGSAIVDATIHTDPFPHIVVERLFPDDFYNLMLEALPPPVFFDQRDRIKPNIPLPLEFGPALATGVWNFIDDVIAQTILRPAVVKKFQGALNTHYDTLFGPSFRTRANALPQTAAGGRLMLRRPGYHLAPHRDPKRSFVTCLLYLARPGDSEAYGTQVFSVVNDREANYKQTYYPEQAGCRCDLVKVVPFRPNTMLAFVNSRGAHGAIIPADAPPEVERYAYQFYVSPQAEDLSALIKDLPKDVRLLWQTKEKVAPEPGLQTR